MSVRPVTLQHIVAKMVSVKTVSGVPYEAGRAAIDPATIQD
jgi:hypothetical protein